MNQLACKGKEKRKKYSVPHIMLPPLLPSVDKRFPATFREITFINMTVKHNNWLNLITRSLYVSFFGLHVSVIFMTIIRSVRAKEITMQQRFSLNVMGSHHNTTVCTVLNFERYLHYFAVIQNIYLLLYFTISRRKK
jgi:hypothetical protein